MRHVNIPIFIPHVGCPFTCIFCNQRRIAAQMEPLPPSCIPDLVDRHLATIPPGSHIEIAFFGGSFTMMDVHLQEAYLQQVSPYLHNGLVKGLRVSTRPDGIDVHILGMLRYWGVDTVELGIQSFDDGVLVAAGRGTTAREAVEACALLKEYGFKLGIQLMVGLPGDDRHKDLKSTLNAIRLQPDMVRIYPTLVISGTELAERWQQGRYQELTLDEAIDVAVDMLLLFQYYHIPVIRLGLQPTLDLQCAETLLAGPYHPAFGELVEQRIFYRQAYELLMTTDLGALRQRPLRLLVNPRDVSRMTGQRRCNLVNLEKELGLVGLKVAQSDQLAPNHIGITCLGDEAVQILKRSVFIQRLIDQGLLPILA